MILIFYLILQKSIFVRELLLKFQDQFLLILLVQIDEYR